ncbi:unnamed protein product [Allacma fusca]|uniref:Lipocalin/cytosolic fatty-acid binding domain-containing protein n=1 Tax=Allacma fusca TaxID=39272 RepID=A0A8J2L0R8_9HEXA|nr:unnamed protein product [Allacma fusca]
MSLLRPGIIKLLPPFSRKDTLYIILGVNLVLRKLGSTAKPVTEIDEKDGNWRITTKTTFKTTEIKFRLGVPFEEETADGRKCQVIIICHENLINNDAVGSV